MSDSNQEQPATGPHQDQPLVEAGTPLDDAEAAFVLVHGRGATARGIVGLGDEIGVDGVAYLAPQAHRGSWYPNSFLQPIDSNEPGLTSGLQAVGDAIGTAADAGIPTENVVVGGFSQGACLATEYVARNTTRYGGVVALSGGLIGPEGTPRDYAGNLAGTPVFLGCSDVDPHIPVERVHETRDTFERLDGDVTEQIYEGMGHTVIPDEIAHVRELLQGVLDG